jgi:mono/diheme cytochrome c family protein
LRFLSTKLINQSRILLTAGIAAVLGAIQAASPQASPQIKPPQVKKVKIDYQRDIAPLFQTRCYSCHGPALQTNGLRLDVRAAAMAGGVSGPSIQPGNSAESRLIELVSGTGKIAMPPVGPRLSEEQVGLLRSWIDEGASWPESELPTQAGT